MAQTKPVRILAALITDLACTALAPPPTHDRWLKVADPRTAIPKSAYNFTKPVLLLTATDDPLGTPALAENSTRPYAPDLTVRAIKSGHFLMLEKANEVNEALKAFIEG